MADYHCRAGLNIEHDDEAHLVSKASFVISAKSSCITVTSKLLPMATSDFWKVAIPVNLYANKLKLARHFTAHLLLDIQKQKYVFKSSVCSLSFSLPCQYCTWEHEWDWSSLIATFPVLVPLQDKKLWLSNVFSLWIKASAKWLNVNVNVFNFSLRLL